MPFFIFLGTVINAFVQALFVQFMAILTRKFAIGTATILAYVATTIAMVVCLKSILTALVVLITIPAWVYTFIGWFIPSNAVGVISQILAANVCKKAYDITVAKIQMMNMASGT
jgi:hypothetical protein